MTESTSEQKLLNNLFIVRLETFGISVKVKETSLENAILLLQKMRLQ